MPKMPNAFPRSRVRMVPTMSDSAQQPAIPASPLGKLGPARKYSYKWILIANKCVPLGSSISDEEIGRFVSAADFRD